MLRRGRHDKRGRRDPHVPYRRPLGRDQEDPRGAQDPEDGGPPSVLRGPRGLLLLRLHQIRRAVAGPPRGGRRGLQGRRPDALRQGRRLRQPPPDHHRHRPRRTRQDVRTGVRRDRQDRGHHQERSPRGGPGSASPIIVRTDAFRGALLPHGRAGEGAHPRGRHLPGGPVQQAGGGFRREPPGRLPRAPHHQPVSVHVLPVRHRRGGRRGFAGDVGEAEGRGAPHLPPRGDETPREDR